MLPVSVVLWASALRVLRVFRPSVLVYRTPLLFGLFLLCFRTLYVGTSFVILWIVAISFISWLKLCGRIQGMYVSLG